MSKESRLTEVTLRVRNHAQPFVKVELPAGAQLLSAEVEGERVKPVQGADGSRVPLLRAGIQSGRRLHRLVRLPELRCALREKRRLRDGSAEAGCSGESFDLGSLFAGSARGEAIRRGTLFQRNCFRRRRRMSWQVMRMMPVIRTQMSGLMQIPVAWSPARLVGSSWTLPAR